MALRDPGKWGRGSFSARKPGRVDVSCPKQNPDPFPLPRVYCVRAPSAGRRSRSASGCGWPIAGSAGRVWNWQRWSIVLRAGQASHGCAPPAAAAVQCDGRADRADQSPRRSTPATPTASRSSPTAAVARPAPTRPPARPRPRPIPVPPPHRTAALPVRRAAVRHWRDWLLDAPPWLLSLLFHLLVLTLLGLLEVQPRVPARVLCCR